jgi:putative sterol carrier protein
MSLRRDLAQMDPAEVYEFIASMDEDDFAALMDEPEPRTRIITALIDHMATLFRPDKAEGIDATIHIKLWDKPGGGYDHFELVIANQTCEISDSPESDPDLTLKVRPTDLRKLVTGDAGPRRLALKGRLRVLGDIGLGMKLPDLFAFGR